MATPQQKANQKLHDAILRGDIVRGSVCELCGYEGRSDGHHDDYSRPLEVRWMCRQCHIKWHLRYGPGKSGSHESLARRVEKLGVITQYPAAFVAALIDSIRTTGAYMGDDGSLVPASAILKKKLGI